MSLGRAILEYISLSPVFPLVILNEMIGTQLQGRQRNKYSANCSACGNYIEPQAGYLFKNTRYRNSRGHHVKCEDCCTGVTAKRLREVQKLTRGKTLSVTFAKKWLESLDVKTIKDEWGVYCEVYYEGVLILGYCNACEGWQEYPNSDWCQEQAQRLQGCFTDKAIDYICETLTELIQEKLNVPLSCSTGDVK